VVAGDMPPYSTTTATLREQGGPRMIFAYVNDYVENDYKIISANQARIGQKARCPYCGRKVVLEAGDYGRGWVHLSPYAYCPATMDTDDIAAYIDGLEFQIEELEAALQAAENSGRGDKVLLMASPSSHHARGD